MPVYLCMCVRACVFPKGLLTHFKPPEISRFVPPRVRPDDGVGVVMVGAVYERYSRFKLLVEL